MKHREYAKLNLLSLRSYLHVNLRLKNWLASIKTKPSTWPSLICYSVPAGKYVSSATGKTH